MGSTTIWELILLAFLILLNGLLAAAEVALVSVHRSRGKLRSLAAQGVEAARVAERVVEDSSRFLATIQVGITLVGFLSAATAAASLADGLARLMARTGVTFLVEYGRPIAVALITFVLAGVTLVFGELVPKTIALRHAERIALAAARPVDLLARLLGPPVRLLVSIGNLVTRLLGVREHGSVPFVTEEEIKALIDAGQEGGAIEEEEKEMILSVFEFGDTLTREVMVPRVDMVAIEGNTPLPEAVDVALKEGHSRIPVYEGTIDNIVGMLHTKDLLVYLKDRRSDVPLRSILRKAYYVPETKRVRDLLEELQQRRIQAAIVVDEYGGTAGMVTIEDMVEEIVGEIEDEDDVAEEVVERVGPGELVVDGRLPVDDVSRLLGVQLPSEGVDTLGGLIFARLGRVPAVGDEATINDVVLTVLAVSGRRIGKVRVRTAAAVPAGEPAGAADEAASQEGGRSQNER